MSLACIVRNATSKHTSLSAATLDPPAKHVGLIAALRACSRVHVTEPLQLEQGLGFLQGELGFYSVVCMDLRVGLSYLDRVPAPHGLVSLHRFIAHLQFIGCDVLKHAAEEGACGRLREQGSSISVLFMRNPVQRMPHLLVVQLDVEVGPLGAVCLQKKGKRVRKVFTSSLSDSETYLRVRSPLGQDQFVQSLEVFDVGLFELCGERLIPVLIVVNH